jgi:hypothetical protein
MGSATSLVCELPTAFLLQPLRDNRIFRETGAGSFIRPLPSLQHRGKTFLSALINKYVEQPHGSDTRETVVLGSSNGAIQVEAVNLDKIRGKFSNVERLRQVSLDNEGVSLADQPGEIRKNCPSQSYRSSVFPSDVRAVDQKMSEASTSRTALFQVGTSLP